MFWIGFIVGMVVLALLGFGSFMLCLKLSGASWEDYTNLQNTIGAAFENRDSRVEVYCENTNEKVFEAGFKYPWGDNVD